MQETAKHSPSPTVVVHSRRTIRQLRRLALSCGAATGLLAMPGLLSPAWFYLATAVICGLRSSTETMMGSSAWAPCTPPPASMPGSSTAELVTL